ncbi:MAG: flagellar motor protein [Gammaproteobacteria bacterium]|nr:flagellar motor protein [Gammaproteobacteria bacterium]
MDSLSFVGAVVALTAILVGQSMEGGSALSLLNGPALLIVLGGSVGAIMLQSPISNFRRALQIFPWVMFPPQQWSHLAIGKVLEWSDISRRNGLLGLENSLDQENDPYTRKALQMLVDGRDPLAIRSTLEVDIDCAEQRDMAAAKVFESMGGYAPTIGIIGAVIGLIQVMENLSDPSLLGAGIATAFVATIYGVALANLFLLPVANKLKAIIESETRTRELLMEGIISIAEGENPRNIELKLKGFVG